METTRERKARLIAEHGDLVKQKSNKGLTHVEETRLTMIEVELDQIEDAESGKYLDSLRTLLASEKKFSEEIDSVVISARKERET